MSRNVAVIFATDFMDRELSIFRANAADKWRPTVSRVYIYCGKAVDGINAGKRAAAEPDDRTMLNGVLLVCVLVPRGRCTRPISPICKVRHIPLCACEPPSSGCFTKSISGGMSPIAPYRVPLRELVDAVTCSAVC